MQGDLTKEEIMKEDELAFDELVYKVLAPMEEIEQPESQIAQEVEYERGYIPRVGREVTEESFP
jgi:hypothetical protein